MRDIDKPDYPLPCDPVTGKAWWRWNMALCLCLPGYRGFQKDKTMAQLIPVLRWMVHAPIEARQQIERLRGAGLCHRQLRTRGDRSARRGRYKTGTEESN